MNSPIVPRRLNKRNKHKDEDRRIHEIRHITLKEVDLESEYEVLQTICEVWTGKILLVEHRATRHEAVLKALHKDSTSKAEFLREFHYSFYLSPHKSILTTYDVAFRAADFYVMATEYAPFGDLACYVSNGGVGEHNTKLLLPQLVGALDFMHSRRLVHRNVRLDNILVFKSDLSRVKLADFDQTRPIGCKAKRGDEWPPYNPPEVQKVEKGDRYDVTPAHDTWQLAIVMLVCLSGALPWQRADSSDARYTAFQQWRGYRALRAPQRFGEFTYRFQSVLRRVLDSRPSRRAAVNELARCVGYKWVAKSSSSSGTSGEPEPADATSVCYSTWSVHSCVREKNVTLGSLRAMGLETVVDRDAKRQRLKEWVAMAALSEDLEEEEGEEEAVGSTGSTSSYRQRSLTNSIPEEDEV